MVDLVQLFHHLLAIFYHVLLSRRIQILIQYQNLLLISSSFFPKGNTNFIVFYPPFFSYFPASNKTLDSELKRFLYKYFHYLYSRKNLYLYNISFIFSGYHKIEFLIIFKFYCNNLYFVILHFVF